MRGSPGCTHKLCCEARSTSALHSKYPLLHGATRSPAVYSLGQHWLLRQQQRHPPVASPAGHQKVPPWSAAVQKWLFSRTSRCSKDAAPSASRPLRVFANACVCRHPLRHPQAAAMAMAAGRQQELHHSSRQPTILPSSWSFWHASGQLAKPRPRQHSGRRLEATGTGTARQLATALSRGMLRRGCCRLRKRPRSRQIRLSSLCAGGRLEVSGLVLQWQWIG